MVPEAYTRTTALTLVCCILYDVFRDCQSQCFDATDKSRRLVTQKGPNSFPESISHALHTPQNVAGAQIRKHGAKPSIHRPSLKHRLENSNTSVRKPLLYERLIRGVALLLSNIGGWHDHQLLFWKGVKRRLVDIKVSHHKFRGRVR